MAVTFYLAAIYASGLIVGGSKNWKFWVPVALTSGAAANVFGRMLGVI